MAPIKSVRTRRSSYTWSSDSTVIGTLSQWPELDSSSGRSADESSDVGDSEWRKPRAVLTKTNYESDSSTASTPRSRRTLRRTVSVTESSPTIETPALPALDTIFSPTHEILHPMQSLLLEKTLSKSGGQTNPVALCLTTPTSKTVDFASYRLSELSSTDTNTGVGKSEKGGESDGVDYRSLATLQGENSEAGAVPAVVVNIVVIIVDAEKKPTFTALDWAIRDAVQPGDELIILGVLKYVSSPMGYKLLADVDKFTGVSRETLDKEVQKTEDLFERKLSESGRRTECEDKKIKLTVRIAPGAPVRAVVVRELTALKATYAIFDRKAMRGRKFYGKHLSCHAVRMRRNGRSTKTITLLAQHFPTKSKKSTSDTSSVSSLSTDRTSSGSPSPTFWRRITSFRSSRRSQTPSPRSSTDTSSPKSELPSPLSATGEEPHAFLSELKEFSISLDHSKDLTGFDNLSSKLSSLQLSQGTNPSLALQSCVATDTFSYKHGMDSYRNHRAISVSIPPIRAS